MKKTTLSNIFPLIIIVPLGVGLIFGISQIDSAVDINQAQINNLNEMNKPENCGSDRTFKRDLKFYMQNEKIDTSEYSNLVDTCNEVKNRKRFNGLKGLK